MTGMDPETLLARAYDDESEYLATVRALVEHESPSHRPDLANRLADHLQGRLVRDGWAVDRLARSEVGDVLVARLEGADPQDGTLILAHYDTVWPEGTLATMPWRRDGDVIFGPGILDMKAGIATALHGVALARGAGKLRGPVTLLITSDEEAASVHSRAEIEALAGRHARVLVVEPSREDGALKIGRKGVGEFRVAFEGRSAHAGNDPENGASALRELAHFLLFAESSADPEAATTVAVTVVEGGTVVNVVPERAEALIDLRVLRAGEAERVENTLANYEPRDDRVRVRVTGGMNRPPMEPTESNRALYAEAVARGAEMHLSLASAVVGGGSDGNFTSAMGVPTLDGLGSAGAGSHARDERIRVKETLERMALLAALLSGS